MSRDNGRYLQGLMSENKIALVSDAQAIGWIATDALLCCGACVLVQLVKSLWAPLKMHFSSTGILGGVLKDPGHSQRSRAHCFPMYSL